MQGEYNIVVCQTKTYTVLSCDTDGHFDNGYRFRYNGQMKDNEIAGIGNHNTALFWEYDTRLGRRWNRDPEGDINISDYATFANNPILNSDLLGNSYSAINKSSAQDAMEIIKKDFGENGKAFTDLLSVGKDGMTFNRIDPATFQKALTTMKGSPDSQNLATGYYNAINDVTETFFGVLGNEKLKIDNPNVASDLKYKMEKKVPHGDALIATGGGATDYSAVRNQSMSLIRKGFSTMNISNCEDHNLSDQTAGRKRSSNGELLAHESLGHGNGALMLALTNHIQIYYASENTRVTAIQMTNLYYRAMGIKGYRTGASHNKGTPFKEAQQVPLGISIGRFLFGKH